MNASELTTLLWTFGLITAGIWGLTEIFGDTVFRKMDKPLIAVILGAIFYPVLTSIGVFSFPFDLGLNLWKQIVASVILGMICVGASALLNDKVINPFRDLFREREK